MEKILKSFNILYLGKSKQEFLNLMREKEIQQQTDNKSTLNKTGGRQKWQTRKSTLKLIKIKKMKLKILKIMKVRKKMILAIMKWIKIS